MLHVGDTSTTETLCLLLKNPGQKTGKGWEGKKDKDTLVTTFELDFSGKKADDEHSMNVEEH